MCNTVVCIQGVIKECDLIVIFEVMLCGVVVQGILQAYASRKARLVY